MRCLKKNKKLLGKQSVWLPEQETGTKWPPYGSSCLLLTHWRAEPQKHRNIFFFRDTGELMLKKIPSILLVWVKTDYTESFRLEITFKGDLVQHPEMCRDVFNYMRLLRALSNLTLNVSRDGTFTLSLGNLFWCFISLIMKKKTSSLYLSLILLFSFKPLTLM